MRLLITGSSGFVGGALAGLAIAEGHQVFGVGRRPAGEQTQLPSENYASVDLGRTHPNDLPELPWCPDAVVHCAARSSPYGSIADYERDNVLGTERVVTWCERLGVARLVHVSSSSVLYRDGDQFNLTEDSPVGPTFANAYARTKAISEQAAGTFSGSVAIARPRAVFGPGDTVLFPRIIAAAQAGKLPLLTGRSEPAVGDLIYIGNLTAYLLQLAMRPELTGVYHLTNAEPVQTQAMLLKVVADLGLPAPTRQVKVSTALRLAAILERVWRVLRLRGEPPITRFGVGVLSWSKTFLPDNMLRDLGPPEVPVDEGIDRFVTWQRERL